VSTVPDISEKAGVAAESAWATGLKGIAFHAI